MSAPKGYNPFVTHAANSYGSNRTVLDRISDFESSRNPNAVNETPAGLAAGRPVGIDQFVPSTFAEYAPQAVAANPAAWKGVRQDVNDWRAQLLTTSWALANGKGKAWATFDRAKAGQGWVSRGVHTTSPFGSAMPAPAQTSQAPSSGPSSTVLPGLPAAQVAAKQAAVSAVFQGNPFMQSLLTRIIARQGEASPDLGSSAPSMASGGSRAAAPAATGAGGQLVATALKEVGTTAASAMKYIHAVDPHATGLEAWCGDFVQWVFKQRGLPAPPARSVPNLLAWARKNQHVVKVPSAGDLVAIDFDRDGTPDHVEIVRGRIKGGVSTVGGNTSTPSGARGVATKNRLASGGAMTYIRAA